MYLARTREAPRGRGVRIEVFYWKCPGGHEESDELPLPERLWCEGCQCFYFIDEVTARGEKREVAYA